jgi:hypothetical protein
VNDPACREYVEVMTRELSGRADAAIESQQKLRVGQLRRPGW